MISYFDEGGMEPKRQQPEQVDEKPMTDEEFQKSHMFKSFPIKYDPNRPLAGADSLVEQTMGSYVNAFNHTDKMQLMFIEHMPLSLELVIVYLNRIGLLRGMVFTEGPVDEKDDEFKMRAKIWLTSGGLCIRHITSIRPELTEALVAVINDPTAVTAMTFSHIALLKIAQSMNAQEHKTPLESFVGLMIANALEIDIPIPDIKRDAEACRLLLADIFNFYYDPR